ncbi:MAG: T9SS type A sorting domain-containing protein [Bacteroidia bacterium]|nr:T9SS type A sorting domain-containing protein [Bacteroidia bacterium]
MKRLLLPFLAMVSVLLLAAGTIDLNNLINYSNRDIPMYVLKDNTPPFNDLTDAGATLGRVLFYDKKLSANNTISCASCHQQEYAFSDPSIASVGLNGGFTGRHAMRLANSRFSDEMAFFWDERAASLEEQTTQPIRDHVEMGFSAINGAPGFDSLIRKMGAITYYPQMFELVFGTPEISEERMQQALAQFIRSITSFDSRFDSGFAAVNNLGQPFPNFTQQENMGKMLYLQTGAQGGAGCQGCHRAPEFDIAPNSGNNGVIGVIGDPATLDLTNVRAPSLRDLVNPAGIPNGPFMHDGSLATLMDVINHYDSIAFDPNVNNNLDPRLRGGTPGQGPPTGQNLQLTQDEKDALVAFLMTLTGSDLYSNEIWSDPFDANGELNYIPLNTTSVNEMVENQRFKAFPNPAIDQVNFSLPSGEYQLHVLGMNGQLVAQSAIRNGGSFMVSNLQPGMYIFHARSTTGEESFSKKIIVR